MNSICLNGRMISADKPSLMADNKSYRYGDGLFETMKIRDRQIALADLHFERFFNGLKLLKFDIPETLTIDRLSKQILLLCAKNNCDGLARVRLSAFRGNGGVFEGDNDVHYLIEAWPLNLSQDILNENGLEIDIYNDALKSCDKFSNLKSANYLPYVMGARYAKEHRLNDCLILNTHGRICDSTIANVFIVKNELISTPPLSEGCVAGVMRRTIILQEKVEEKQLTIDDVLTADELFLTNAIHGMRWVKQLGKKSYGRNVCAEIYARLLKTN